MLLMLYNCKNITNLALKGRFVRNFEISNNITNSFLHFPINGMKHIKSTPLVSFDHPNYKKDILNSTVPYSRCFTPAVSLTTDVAQDFAQDVKMTLCQSDFTSGAQHPIIDASVCTTFLSSSHYENMPI